MKSNLNISKIIIYIILIIYWGIFSYLYLHKLDPSPSILLQEHDAFSIKGEELLLGKKISQEFVSKYDNLGIIALRFQTFERINDDTLIFRLKEINDPTWYYVANYKTDQFQDHQLFPFGFPIIKDSKGKTFLFEVESRFGSTENYVKIDRLLPTLISKHQYVLRKEIFSSETAKYLLLKIQNMLSSLSLLFPIIFYSLPLFQFIFHNILIVSHKKVVPYIIIFPFLLIIINQPLSLSLPAFWEITIILTWIIYLLVNRITYKLNLVVSMLSMIFIIFQLIANNIDNAELGSLWLFILLLISIIHNIIIFLFKIKTIDLKEFYCIKL